MPELPEVQTIVRELNEKIINRTIINSWTEYQSGFYKGKKNIKDPKYFVFFEKSIKNQKIVGVQRRAKNILIKLENNKTILIHLKMTGHLLYGDFIFNKVKGIWQPPEGFLEKGNQKEMIKNPLRDPFNRFIRLIFQFDNDKFLALSDMRKFASIQLLEEFEVEALDKKTGPEPLSLNFKDFLSILKNEKRKIKTVLMDPKVIAGIGNIYADEILFQAQVYPLRATDDLEIKEFQKIYQAIKLILLKAIEQAGTSISDFRRVSGDKGKFQETIKVYRRQGEKCLKCEAIIERKKLNDRSTYFCPKCQPIITQNAKLLPSAKIQNFVLNSKSQNHSLKLET